MTEGEEIDVDDEDRGVPCCVLDAARWVTKVRVGPNLVGIMEFAKIMDEVHAMGPMDDDERRVHLLKRTKTCNYVPSNAEDAYADAMLGEYHKLFDDLED